VLYARVRVQTAMRRTNWQRPSDATIAAAVGSRAIPTASSSSASKSAYDAVAAPSASDAVCSFSVSGDKGTRFTLFYQCKQCGLGDGAVVCPLCAVKCHAGHRGLKRVDRTVHGYCDCGADDSKCKALPSIAAMAAAEAAAAATAAATPVAAAPAATAAADGKAGADSKSADGKAAPALGTQHRPPLPRHRVPLCAYSVVLPRVPVCAQRATPNGSH
jgi:hypothetical protein